MLFKALVFSSPPTESVRPLLATYSSLCSTCVTYGMPCHTIIHQTLPTHPLLWVLKSWESVFYSQVFFTLHSLLLFSRRPWGQQFNLKVSRASYWSSKHSPALTICLNHSNPRKRYTGRFYLRVGLASLGTLSFAKDW